MLNQKSFLQLLEKYSLDTISPEERSELFEAITSGIYDDVVLQYIEGNFQDKAADGANLPPHRSAEILHKILSSEKQTSLLIPKKKAKLKIIHFAIAAAVLGAIAFSAYLLNAPGKKGINSNTAFTKGLNERGNTSTEALKVEMEEGTMITLQPGSVIRYPTHFLPGKREVFLEGDAFFEVSKDAARPFFVYNKNIVTHVLGTSFNFKLNSKTGHLEVSVRSGRVEVYENKSSVEFAGSKKNNGVILLPNQKVIYDEDTHQFVPLLADTLLPVVNEFNNNNIPAESFVFEDSPLDTVLGSLAKTYGIEIVAETDNIYRCRFTGDISRQDLYTRLDFICQAVQASYEVKGTKILIKGAGCN